jgi:DNA-directed RNA polymerase subunit M/transcription elongation factor TFIIS
MNAIDFNDITTTTSKQIFNRFSKLLTTQQIEELLSLTYVNVGEQDRPIRIFQSDDVDYELIIEVISIIRKLGYVEALRQIKKASEKDEILFANSLMKNVRNKAMFEISIIKSDTDVGQTGEVCKNPKCRSTNTRSRDIQTRSADEPMTHFLMCNSCGKVFKS